MNIFWHKVEKLVDKTIPLCLIVLLPIIVVELFYKDIAHHYHHEILILDGIIVAVFLADLVFKYIRVKNIPLFVKRYWLDILAVFPFYAVFRAFEQIALIINPLSETFQSSQMILHEGLELEKEGSKIVKEAGKISRYEKLNKFVARIARIPRLLKILPYFEKSTGYHHHHDKEHINHEYYRA